MTTINLKLASKLRKLAEALPDKIEHLRRPLTQNSTPKRMREYNSRVIDGDNLDRGRLALLALASAHERGDVPEILAQLKSKNEIVPLVRHGIVSNSYYHIGSTHEFADKSPVGVALQALLKASLTTQSQAEQAAVKRERELQALLDRVRFSDIPGFFPSPPALVRLILDQAELRPGMTVFEPSAGIGSIADAARAIVDDGKRGGVQCVEVNSTLCEILRAKGYPVPQGDFLAEPTGRMEVDRVLMNPPFERGQDCDHVRHAFGFLKPGGKLVAIVSSGVFFRQDNKCVEFREWLREFGGKVIDLEDAFNTAEAFRATGVSCKMIVVEKGVSTRSQLAEALLVGLAQEDEDADDERFAAQALAITAEDRY